MRRVGLLSAMLLVAGCSGGDEVAPGEVLRADIIGSFDAKASRTQLTGPRAALTEATQVGLVSLDSAGQVVPGLATSWRVSDDGLSYIFRLREAKWPDGRVVRATDIVTAYRRILAPGSNHPLKGMLDRIENAPAVMRGGKGAASLGVVDPLPNIVEIRLSAPQPALLELLAHPSMAILKPGAFPPSLGAFTVAGKGNRTETQPLRLTRNPGYFDASAVALSGIELLPVADPVAAITRFRRSATDIVVGAGLSGFGEARTVALPRALRVEAVYGVYGYAANVRRGPLADLRLRRAMTMVIDRTAIAQRLFAVASMQPVPGLVPPGLPSYPQQAVPAWTLWTPEERLAEARRLVTEAGFSPAKPLVLRVTLPEGREHDAVLAAVAQAWQPLGVTVKSETVMPAQLAKRIAAGRFDLALVERYAPVDSARFFLQPFGCAVRTGGYCNREADRILDAARANPDLPTRAATIRRAEQLMIDDTPMIALFVPVRWALVHPRVAGWTDNILGAHPLQRLDVLPDRTE